MEALSYGTYSEARVHLKDLLDAAGRGRPAFVRREGSRAAVVDADRLQRALVKRIPSSAVVVPERDGWSALIPGMPIAADGATFDEAIDELVVALREYADDWQDHLLDAANHREHWDLVQLITLSADDQLRAWLVGGDG